MRVSSCAGIESEFLARAHRMVWRHMATVGPDGRPRTRVVHPVWDGAAAWITSLRVGPKAEDIDRNQSCCQKPLEFPHSGGRIGTGHTIVLCG